MLGKQYVILVVLLVIGSTQGFEDGTMIQIWNCTNWVGQKWYFAQDGSDEIRLTDDGKCIDIENWSSDNGAKVHLWDCHPDNEGQNQQWNFESNGEIKSLMSGKCLTVKDVADPGSLITTWDCDGSANQIWTFNNDDGTFRIELDGQEFCMDVGSYPPVLTCDDPAISSLPFCDWKLPIPVRVADLLSRMTLEEKMSQMLSLAPPVSRLGIQPYNWWSECLHGVLSGCGKNCPTSFPAPSALGATFNMTLVHDIASAISDEARALNNEGVTGLDYWAPNININRDPRWGRNQEVPGEDPFLTGQYVMNFIRGLQEGVDTRYTKVVGTCKHYAAYSLEDWGGVDRFHFDAIVTDQDLVDTYLPAFESCVEKGRAKSVMCSYNSVNGVPACANDFLLQDILRDTYLFDGYVVSDCDAIDCIQNSHQYTDNPADTCQVAVKAGCDLNCGNFYKNMDQAVDAGKLSEADIDLSVGRLLSQRFAVGMWDPKDIQYYTTLPPEVVDSEAHQQLALQSARESMVLLKNERSTLPLTTNLKVAVIGPNANVSQTLLSNYYGQRCLDGTFNCITTPLDAIRQKGAQVTYAKGCDINSQNTTGFAEAVAIAKKADVAVLFLGLDNSIEAESLDRYSIALPGVQEQLAQAIIGSYTPVVIVLINGGSVSSTWMKLHVPAIIEAFYGGEMASYAIADVLFGDYNPGGKLPFTVYPEDYVNQINMTDMGMTSGPGRTYRYYKGETLWDFGFGLSYTRFNLTWVNGPTIIEGKFVDSVDLRRDVKGATVNFRVIVTNIGQRLGDEVVMVFKYGTSPLKQLIGFQRVTLAPGESTEVFIAAELSAFSRVTEDGTRILESGSYEVGVTNGHDNHLAGVVHMKGPSIKLFSLPPRK